MKKLFLTLFAIVLFASAWAQSQRSTLRGKTKDGKTLTVQYYQGTVEDRIESVKYQLVDELQDEIKNLKNNIKDLQNRLDATNKEVKQLNKQLEKSSGNQDDISALNQQIAEKTEEITQLSGQLDSLVNELNQAQEENNRLQAQLDSLQAVRITQNQKKSIPEKTPVIGMEAGLGTVLLGNSANGLWAKDIPLGTQFALYFGTARLSESLPISFEAGLGFRRFTMAAHLSQYEHCDGSFRDKDGDAYEAIYSFENLAEHLSMSYLDIPIRICIGQPLKDRVSVYAKLGITPSLNIGSPEIDGTGTYGVKGYYEKWDVTLENIPELGFVSNRDFYEENEVETEINKFNLWANVVVGAYMPFKNTPIVLNAGFKLDYPILKVGETSFKDDSKHLSGWHTGLLQNGGKVWIPTFEVGVVYTLK
jgi:uncharacterized coiled-coil protein SlyX